MSKRDFLTLNDLSHDEFQGIMQRAIELKEQFKSGEHESTLKGRVLAMVFEKSSTRTRVSFEAGMAQLGGHAIYLAPTNTQIGRGEPVEDTARVLSNMVDAIMIRTFEQSKIEKLAEYASKPVINALSDTYHPCQLLADIQTYIEQRGSIQGKTVCWLGDGNNMCHSYINAAKLCDFKLHVGCPEDYAPDADIVDSAKDRVTIFHDPKDAVEGVDVVVTDVWASMGQEEESAERINVFSQFQVDAELMKLADKDALFMHCLPAHRGEEVTAEVLEGEQSVVWEEAGNRLHSQKALLEFLILGK